MKLNYMAIKCMSGSLLWDSEGKQLLKANSTGAQLTLKDYIREHRTNFTCGSKGVLTLQFFL